MVDRFLKSLGGSVRGLHQAAYLLAGLTLASQLLALLRDRIFAHAFGASATLDLYYSAFRIPDIVFALIASLVSAYVLIPRITNADKQESKKLLSHAASFLIIVGGAFSLLLVLCMPIVARLLFPSYAENADFILLARLLLLQPILLGLSGVLTSVTQVERRFVLFALSPVLYNLGIILGTLILYPYFGVAGIGIGVVLGACAHVALHIPVVIRAGVAPRLIFPDQKIVWGIMKDSIPRSLALSFGALTTLLLTSLAVTTGVGSVSVFTLAGNLAAVPLALIGASYATAAFPVLVEAHKKAEGFTETLSAAARHVLFWSSSVALLTIVLRAHLVRVLYGSGAFDWDATRLTAALLAVLIVGLVAQGFILLASRAFYATGRSWNPLIIQVIGLIVSVLSAVGFLALAAANPTLRFFIETLLRLTDIHSTSVIWIALGATIGQLVMGVLALITLQSVAPGVARSLSRPMFESLGAGIVGSAAAYSALTLMGNIAPLTTLPSVFTQGAVAGMVGLSASAAVLILLENREFKDLFASLRKITERALQPSGTVVNDQSNS